METDNNKFVDSSTMTIFQCRRIKKNTTVLVRLVVVDNKNGFVVALLQLCVSRKE